MLLQSERFYGSSAEGSIDMRNDEMMLLPPAREEHFVTHLSVSEDLNRQFNNFT